MSPRKQKFSIVSLGCARNLVDSEVMAGLLQQSHYEMVPEPADADVVLVNTCGFIDAAKAESIDTIIEVSRLKDEGKIKKLVVAGCLAQRYSQELAAELERLHHVPDCRKLLARRCFQSEIRQQSAAEREEYGLPELTQPRVSIAVEQRVRKRADQ